MVNTGSDNGFVKKSLKAVRNAAFAAGTLVSPVTLGTAAATALVLDTACAGGGSNNPEPINHAPTLTSGIFDNNGVPFNSSKSINLAIVLHSADQDNDTLSYRISGVTSGAGNGTATITGSSLTFVPSMGIEGSQVLQIVAVDAKGAISNPATLTINNIDTKAPVISDPIPDTTSLTNQDITVIITSAENDDITSDSTGWIRSGGAGNWTFSKIYTSNISDDPFVAKDRAGNLTTKLVTITNIDKQGPVVDDASYSTVNPTNQDVTVVFKTLENLDAPTGWTKGTDSISGKYTFTKSYSANITETVSFFDKAGNKTDKVVNIGNIDKTPPALVTFDANATQSTLDIRVTINENGKGYVYFPGMILGTAPSAQDVIDHATQNGTVLDLVKDQEKGVFFNALLANTSYVAYFVSEDALTNRSAVTTKTFNTLVKPDSLPTLAAPSIRGTIDTITLVNNIFDEDGIRNITFHLYSDASATVEVANTSDSGGAFSGLTPNTDYYARTKADTLNSATQVWTNVTSQVSHFKTLVAIPNTPSGLSASNQTTNSFQVTWGNIVGATTYQVFLDGVLAGNTSVNSFTALGLTPNTTYSVTVASENASGVSALSSPLIVNTLALDPNPNQFTFTDVSGASRGTVYTSNSFTVQGINTSAPISITGGTYSINGGAWISTPGLVNFNDTVQVQIVSSSNFSASVSAVLSIGTVTDSFDVTTLAQDITPVAFDITDMTAQALNTAVTTNTVTISGMNDVASASTTVGTLVKNGVDTGFTSMTVANGDTLAVALTTSAIPGTTTNGTITVGTFTDAFSVTTVGPDTTPDVFTLTDVGGASRSTVYTSNTITVAGINTAAPISITGGEYAINGGAWTTVAGTVNINDTVQVRLTSNAAFNTPTTATLNIGGVTEGFVVTTLAQDITPVAFDITDMTAQALNAAITTNTVTISGMNDVATASTTVGTLVKNGTDTGLTSTTITNGDTLAVKLTTSGTPSAIINGSLTVGTFSDNFSVTNVGPDTTPDVFVFTDVTGATKSTQYTSNVLTITGINTAAPISITGGQYRINGGAWTAVSGTVNNGQTVEVQITSSATDNTTVTATLNIGGVIDGFDVTTAITSLPATPTGLALTNDTGSSNSDGITSNATLSWNAVSGATGYEISANGTTWTDIGNVLTIDAKVALGLGDGTYTLQVRAKNAGGSGTATTINLTLDTVAPAVVNWSGVVPSAQGTQYVDVILANATNDIATLVSLTDSTGGTISNARVVSGQIVFSWTTPNAGTGTLVAVYRDAAGNEITRTISVALF